ncbi:MAG: biotin--[acetyl-CoA-carboxylase] ligase [Oscillospiraceae bacterium]
MTLKESILEIFEKRRGETISGQDLAQTFGVTRAAVCKAVKALKSEGYKIGGVTKLGYTLDFEDDSVSEPGIRAALGKGFEEREIICAKVLDSTNTEAKRRIAQDGAHEMLIVADKQTGGRGRTGKTFYSPEGTGIYMSAVLCPHAEIDDAVMVTVGAAVAVCRAIERYTGLEPRIKWVNDIFVGGKKVCGILTEAVSGFENGMVEAVVVGIGINVKTAKFPENIKDVAASLNADKLQRRELIAAVYRELCAVSESLLDKEVIEEYRSHSLVLGKEIVFAEKGQSVCAVANSITERGNLVVRLSDGSTRVLRSGEISLGSGAFVGVDSERSGKNKEQK